MSTITPRVDIVFKKIFGVEENKDLLISLINSIVSEADQVQDVTILNPYNPQNFAHDKLSILDIKAKGVDGKRFNIEIQITDEADYDKRALYYWAKLYTEQLKTGQDYGILSKAIGIHILNFTSILENDDYHNVFRITNKKTNKEYFKDLELHTIELKKFSGSTSVELSDLIQKVKTSLDIWLAFLTRHDLLNKENLPQALNKHYLQKALTVLNVMNFTADELEAYEASIKWFMVEANTLKKAEMRGEERGIEIGIEIGKTQGVEIGKTHGIEIVATNLLNQGLDWDLICKATGLSRKELEEIKNKETELDLA